MKKKAVLIILAAIFTVIFASDREDLLQPVYQKFGNYNVGFKAVKYFDDSRTYGFKYNLSGIEQEVSSRPVQLYLWYPTVKDGKKLTIKDFAKLSAEDATVKGEKGNIEEALAKFGAYFRFLPDGESAKEKFLKYQTRSIKDANPAAGKFPLILYFPGGGEKAFENFVMAELLASHGFYVASVTHIQDDAISSAKLHMLQELNDIRFIYGKLKENKFIDQTKLSTIGFCMGGLMELYFAAENHLIDGIVSLYGYAADKDARERFKEENFTDFANKRLKYLELTADKKQRDDFVYDNILYEEKIQLRFPDTGHNNSTSYYVLNSQALGTEFCKKYLKTTPKDMGKVYTSYALYTLNFIKSLYNDDPEYNSFVHNNPEENNLKTLPFEFRFAKAKDIPPTKSQFTALINNGQIEKAVEIFKKQEQITPKISFIDERELNLAGYHYLYKKKDADNALKIFELITKSNPKSFNAFDSLGEAYLAKKDYKKSKECYETALKLNPNFENAKKMLKKIEEQI